MQIAMEILKKAAGQQRDACCVVTLHRSISLQSSTKALLPFQCTCSRSSV